MQRVRRKAINQGPSSGKQRPAIGASTRAPAGKHEAAVVLNPKERKRLNIALGEALKGVPNTWSRGRKGIKRPWRALGNKMPGRKLK